MGIRRQVLEAMADVITDNLAWVKKLETENIRIAMEDFQENELPAVQIFDTGQDAVSQAKDIDKHAWPIAVELVMKSTSALAVTQLDFYDKCDELEDLLEQNRHLLPYNIEGFMHLSYNTFETDIHSTPDFFVARYVFTARYDKHINC